RRRDRGHRPPPARRDPPTSASPRTSRPARGRRPACAAPRGGRLPRPAPQLDVPERAIEMERDAWILVAAQIPDQMPALMALKRAQIEDPAVTAMYLDL